MGMMMMMMMKNDDVDDDDHDPDLDHGSHIYMYMYIYIIISTYWKSFQNIRKTQLFRNSGAEQSQGCTGYVVNGGYNQHTTSILRWSAFNSED